MISKRKRKSSTVILYIVGQCIDIQIHKYSLQNKVYGQNGHSLKRLNKFKPEIILWFKASQKYS